MLQPSIFICHSAKEPAEVSYRDAIAKGLRDAGFHVFVDVDGFMPGDQWHSRIGHWLGLCHGAVAVMSKRMVESSKYCPYELSVLHFRAQQSSQFKLCPIRCRVLRPAPAVEGPLAMRP